MHEYCKNATFYICGDFNARCSNFQDFIEGVDNIQDINVVDFSSNKFGELLCDFLIDSNCCIGGRTGLMVRASDSGSGDPGSILGRVGVFVSLSKRHLLPKSTGNTQE